MERTETHRQVATETSAAGRWPINWHLGACLLLGLLPLLLAPDLVRRVTELALHDDTYTHIPLIPLISLFLIYSDRRSIFSRVTYSWLTGVALVVPGLMAVVSARLNVWDLSRTNRLSLVVFGVVLAWIGAFTASMGSHASKAARFSLLFLLFMVPIPEPLLSKVILFLQTESAQVTAVLFGVFHVPFLQDGLIFSLPGTAIRVAEECSGIRSSLALLIMAVLASRFFLKTPWKQLLVCLFVVPLSIAKNGLRISVLSALAVYVNPEFLTGPIHHKFGGMLFFAAAFVPLALLLFFLQKTEHER